MADKSHSWQTTVFNIKLYINVKKTACVQGKFSIKCDFVFCHFFKNILKLHALIFDIYYDMYLLDKSVTTCWSKNYVVFQHC